MQACLYFFPSLFSSTYIVISTDSYSTGILHKWLGSPKRLCHLSEHPNPGYGRREGQTESISRMPSSLEPPGVRSALHGGSTDAGCAHPRGSGPGLFSCIPPWWVGAGAGSGAVPFQVSPWAEQVS